MTPHSGPATIDVLLKYHASASLPYKPRAAEVLAGLAAIAQTQSEAARG